MSDAAPTPSANDNAALLEAVAKAILDSDHQEVEDGSAWRSWLMEASDAIAAYEAVRPGLSKEARETLLRLVDFTEEQNAGATSGEAKRLRMKWARARAELEALP